MMGVREAILVAVVFAANLIHAITGFAGTLLAMPAAIQLVGLESARVALNTGGLLGCLLLFLQCRQHVLWRECLHITALMFVGMALGMVLLHRFPLDGLLYVYGVVIILMALLQFFGRGFSVPDKLSPLLLLAAGVIHGLFVSGGAMLVVYASHKFRNKAEFRATLTPVWVILNTFILLEQLFSRSFTPQNLTLAGICIPPIFLGILIGNRLYRYVSERTFWRVANVLLLISGLVVFL